MSSDPAVDVLELIAVRFRPPEPGELQTDTDLGPGGYGLDSISLVELLLVCEAHFGVPFPFTLLEEGPITVGRLAGHAMRVRAQLPGE